MAEMERVEGSNEDRWYRPANTSGIVIERGPPIHESIKESKAKDVNAEGSESQKPRAKGQRAIAAALEDAHDESAVFLIS